MEWSGTRSERWRPMPTEAPAPARPDQGRSFVRPPSTETDAAPETLPAGANEPTGAPMNPGITS